MICIRFPNLIERNGLFYPANVKMSIFIKAAWDNPAIRKNYCAVPQSRASFSAMIFDRRTFSSDSITPPFQPGRQKTVRALFRLKLKCFK